MRKEYVAVYYVVYCCGPCFLAKQHQLEYVLTVYLAVRVSNRQQRSKLLYMPLACAAMLWSMGGGQLGGGC
jgi:hypothetical protein